MRLPIRSMQAVTIRPHGPGDGEWFRSVIVDFVPDEEIVVLLPVPVPPKASSQTSTQPVTAAAEEPADTDRSAAEAAAAAASGDLAAEIELNAVEHAGLAGKTEAEIATLFPVGVRLEVEVSLPDGIRRFSSVVRKHEPRFGGAMRLPWPTEGTRIQRRGYVRVDVTCKAAAWFRTPDVEGLQRLAGTTIDLSAGGVRLKLQQRIPDDTRVELELDVPALVGRTLQGEVLRSGELKKERSRPQEYWVAIQFVGVDEGLRKEMTQLVFDTERANLRKHLT